MFFVGVKTLGGKHIEFTFPEVLSLNIYTNIRDGPFERTIDRNLSSMHEQAAKPVRSLSSFNISWYHCWYELFTKAADNT